MDLRQPYWLAYSGGLDSRVLLQLLIHYRQDQAIDLNVIHINHGLHPKALEWSKHCQTVCDELQVPLVIEAIEIADRHNLEAHARHARYQIFERLVAKGGLLLLAHHQQDQVETLLLHCLRGSGVAGLAGMPERRVLGQGQLMRPLLSVPKADLQAYAQSQQLSWMEDDSNQSQRFDRNYLRHTIIPALEVRWPQAQQTMARSASLCAQAHKIIIDQVEDLAQTKTLALDALTAMSLEQQYEVLRTWLKQQSGLSLTAKQWQCVYKTVVSARADAKPLFTWQAPVTGCRWMLRRYKQVLYVLPERLYLPTEPISWALSDVLQLPGLGQWRCEAHVGEGLSKAYCHGKHMSIRFRQGGERLHVQGRCGRHPLKKLMQAWLIPPWQRSRIPLLYADEELIAVLDYAIAAKAYVDGSTEVAYKFINEA